MIVKKIMITGKFRVGSRYFSILTNSGNIRPWCCDNTVNTLVSTTSQGYAPVMRYSNEVPQQSKRKEQMGRLRTVLKEYGAVGVAFHTTISLASLGTCYMVVKSGINVEKIFTYFNIDSTSSAYKTASTMGVAYILHKLFLPVRAVVTITCVPLIVRYLRDKGIMKKPLKQQT